MNIINKNKDLNQLKNFNNLEWKDKNLLKIKKKAFSKKGKKSNLIASTDNKERRNFFFILKLFIKLKRTNVSQFLLFDLYIVSMCALYYV
jgi:hypothetical protein